MWAPNGGSPTALRIAMTIPRSLLLPRSPLGFTPTATVVLGALCAVLLGASASSAKPLAVLAVDAGDAGGDANKEHLLQVADVMRAHMQRQGGEVLDAKVTRERLLTLGVGKGFDLDALKQRVQAAEDAYRALDFERSIDILEGVVRDLSTDAAYTLDKQELLETARLSLVKRLVGLAGNHETGRAETDFGKRAKGHLVNALRANPTLALDPSRYDPKMRRLLEGARFQLQEKGSGSLTVQSRPQGATVYLEGRPIGVTPLRLPDGIAYGRYRFWASLDESRSVTRWIDISATEAQVELDLAFEGALWPQGPGLKPVKGRVINEAVAAKVGALLDVKELILVGTASYDEARWLYGAVYRAGDGETSRRGAVRIGSDGDVPTAKEVAQLARFLMQGDGRSVNADAVPSSVLPGAKEPGKWMVVQDMRPKPTPTTSKASSDTVDEAEAGASGTTFIIAGVAVGTGVGLVVAAGIGTAVAIAYGMQQQDTVGQFDVVVNE